ncbi:MAG: leucine-rich repeat domain-containing protein [Oscillospiraceae bacterium]|nr:leucine-rich repeat domain-containing protein [Oscillospiraceae bacterium]
MKGSVTKRMLKGTRLKEGAFAEREDLTEIILPDEIEDIGEVAFYGCTNLKHITLPRNLKFIREEAFGASGLEIIEIPEGVRLICEKAFFSCEELRRIDVLPKDVIIEVDAFGACPKLLEGFVARGYPQKTNPPEELQYTLLWCTCPERHSEETSDRAKEFIRNYEALVMEHIMRSNNTAALSGISQLGLLKKENISRYVEEAGRNHQTELVTLLLAAARNTDDEDEFSL